MRSPKHIAIIPDGNRRWARSRGLSTIQGHKAGYKNSVELVKKAHELDIKTLTFWAFSTENWNRSSHEVSYLMKIFETFVDDHLREALKNKTKLTHLGRKDRIPKTLLRKILDAEKKTKDFSAYYLNIALDYGGRDEILRTTQKILKFKLRSFDKTQDKFLNLTEKTFSHHLDTGELPYPDPDMIIRPGGEYRLSGFMLWQSPYSELFFPPENFPDFTPDKLENLVRDFSQRQRRFGA